MSLRVLVAEDSLTVRKRLVEVLGAESDIEIVGEAEDGRRAIELCQSLRPDVLTCDMMMPALSGLAVTEYVMAYCPTPILIVSASVNRGEVFKTYEALAAGAVDVLDKPVGDEVADDWERRFVSAVRMVARIKVITHPKGRRSLRDLQPAPMAAPAPERAGTYRLAAIGASTGGPSAIVEILRGLPSGYRLPILFVLHIGAPFGADFSEWLDGQSPIRVRQAKDGEPLPPPGTTIVLMAPPEKHLVLRGDRLRLLETPERHSCRPSVDVLFESLAAEAGATTIACLLTGMGRDGASGLLAIRQAGGATVAQDEATSAVFGMPGEAVALNAAQWVLPLDRVATTLVTLAGDPAEVRR
jgi:two-component system chemotaxis response regulator CheB